MSGSIIVAAVVIAYMAFMLFIGWYSKHMISGNADFMVAGRRLGPILMAGTLAATEIGGGSSLGVVQQGMGKYGISAAWYVIAMGFAFVILTFLAPKFRASTVKTVPEYFRRRYGRLPGIITAIVMFLPLIGLTAGQMIASAVILSTMMGISFKVSVIAICVIVTIYSVMGGLWSVTLTDFVQVFFIVFGMAVAAMPPLVCGILFAGVISATMSSASSDLLGAGSIFANDIYRQYIKTEATDEEVMKVAKIVMVLAGLLSLLVALFNTSSIITILMFSFSLRAAGAFFPYVIGLYWKGASLAGTMASLIAGTIVVVYLEQFTHGVIFGIKFGQPILPGLVVSFIAFIIFSKLMPPKEKTTELAYDEHES